MKRFSQREHDSSFGQIMLTLRSEVGLTQIELAEHLGVTRRSVGEWEAGSKFPTDEHLKQFIELAVRQGAFTLGHEADEIRALWKAAHQKASLDEQWLAELLVPQPRVVITTTPPAFAAPSRGQRVDWGNAYSIPNFYGREAELNQLSKWVVDERCRVVTLLGLGGIGKSALSVRLMHDISENFDVVIWRSLRDALTCEVLLDECLQVLAPAALGEGFINLEQRLSLLLTCLRNQRVLLVLDNLESILEEGAGTGQMRSGYERLLRRVAEVTHQSCLLLTSREKPSVLAPLEGGESRVHSLRLIQLDTIACRQLLAETDVAGTASEQVRLIEAYTGNPLALKIVAQTITDLFDGEIAPFLEQGEVIFGGVRTLLSEQFERLSRLEQTILLWLAILREPTTMDDLRAVLVTSVPRAGLIEAMDALHRRSLIERGLQRGSFTLQSVVLEYVTSRIVSDANEAIQLGKPSRILIEHGFALAQTRQYVQETQQRLIVAPILEPLRGAYSQQSLLEEQLLALLGELRTWEASRQGYAPANVVTLLRILRGNLRGLDLAGLVLRGMYFQGVEMQDASLSGSIIRDSVFNQTFDALSSVAVSSTGIYWAAGSRHGEIRLWTAGGLTLHRAWHAHADMVNEMQFSPDGSLLVTTGSWDGMVKLWDVASGALLWSVKHLGQACGLSFSPDGRLLTSTGYDATVNLWDMRANAPVQIVAHPEVVTSITWSPDGRFMVTGDLKGCIRWWALNGNEPPICSLKLNEHNNCVEGLAFSPDGSILASASWDSTVKLWNVADGSVWQTLMGHTNRATRVAWSPDGRTLVSAGRDQTVWLWDREKVSYRAALYGHSAGVQGLTFTPDNDKVLTVSEDGALRVSKVSDGQSLRLMQGYVASLNDVDWSPDGTQLVSGGSDTLLTIYTLNGRTEPRILGGHLGIVIGTGWSNDSRWIASSEWNNAIRLWDATSGTCIRVLHYPDEAGDYFDRLAWSPDGQRLAIGTYTHGIQLFDMGTQRLSWIGDQISIWIRHVAWNPDGIQLAGGGADGTVYIWDTSEGRLIQRLTGHHSTITDIAWNPDGALLASGSRGTEGGELFIWDVKSGERVHMLQGHPMIVYAVAWTSDANVLISGDDEGTVRWWDMEREACIRIVQAHQGTIHSLRPSPDRTMLASCSDDGAIAVWDLHSGEHLQTLRRDRPYERLNISGIQGLTEAQKAVLRALGAIED